MLAQEWLYGLRVPSDYDEYVEGRLALPTTFNPHSSLAVLNRLAERIVFTDDVPSMLYEMHENKQLTYQGVISSAKLPYDTFWMEYNSNIGMDEEENKHLDYTSYGILVQRMGGECVRMFVIVGIKPREGQMASTLTHILEFDTWPPLIEKMINDKNKFHVKFAIRYAFNEAKLRNSEVSLKATGEVGAIICEILFGIFLITQPKVYACEQVAWSEKKQAKRRAKNKPPLLEYRRIRVHVVRQHRHYARRPAIKHDTSDVESYASQQHRRYHKVMGHFRHYADHTTWIEPHYRGDPKLGITFTERDVMR